MQCSPEGCPAGLQPLRTDPSFRSKLPARSGPRGAMIMYRLVPIRRSLYRVAVLVAAMSFLLGVWRVFVEHDRRPGPFWQLLFPLLVMRLALTLYRRSRSA